MQKVVWSDIERAARKNIAELIFRCEKYFSRQVEAVAEDIYAKNDIKAVFVAGPSSSGKTTFSRLLNEELQKRGLKVHYMGTDDFFIDRARVPFLSSGVRDFDSPVAIDTELLKECIGGILRSEWVEVPEYDFLTGRRKEEKTLLKLHDQDVVIVEGIHALNPNVVGIYDDSVVAKVSIKPRKTFFMPSGRRLSPDELRLLRRTIRDYHTRGYGLAETAAQWAEVLRAEQTYIDPYTEYADYFVDSAFDYELFLYKQCVGDAFDKCAVHEYDNIKMVLAEVTNMPIDAIPSASLLNEFVIK